MTLAFIPGKRITFSRCTLIKRSTYEAQYRDAVALIWRHVFRSPDYDGLIVYSGSMLKMRQGETRSIKATMKREESPAFSDKKFLRISRPFLLDETPALLLEKMQDETQKENKP